MRRDRLQARSSVAFAPGAITNFFEVRYDGPRPVGATGGGYILSKGTRSRATVSPDGEGGIFTVVNGDRGYDARTTRRAVKSLLEGAGSRFRRVSLEQVSETPIGSGFGASAAAATSAVYAVASGAEIRRPKEWLAGFAHEAELVEQTGVGTVSVVFDAVGAGAITVAGRPGEARFLAVDVPRDTRVVTAFLAPYDKKDALSSKPMAERIGRLGADALRGFVDDPSLDNLASQGERFSAALGLESPEVKKMIALAKSAGAEHASQNMIGYSVHSLVAEDRSQKVADALRSLGKDVRVDVFEVGHVRAGVVP